MIGTNPSRTEFFTVRMVTLRFVFLAVLAITSPAPAAALAGVDSGEPITLDVVDVDLKDVLGVLSHVTDFVFAVDAQNAEMGVLDRKVTMNYELTPWDRVLDEILIAVGLEWTLEGKVIWVHLPGHAPPGDRNFIGDPINLRLLDAELALVLENLSKVTGLQMEFDSEIEGTVTVSLREVPWDQVLDLILRISGYAYLQEGEAIRVFRTSENEGMQIIGGGGGGDLELITVS